MKKQILTLSVCLALSATTVMAAPAKAPVAPATPATVTAVTTKTVAVKTADKTVVATKKTVGVKKAGKTKVATKKVVAVKKGAKTVVAKTTSEVTVSPEELARQKFEERMAQERDSFYNKLGLTAEQKTKAEALYNTNSESVAPLFSNVRYLKAKKASFVAICKQKHNVKGAKKALRAHMEASRKQFEAILTQDQLAKLKTMKPCNCAGPCKCHKHHHHEIG